MILTIQQVNNKLKQVPNYQGCFTLQEFIQLTLKNGYYCILINKGNDTGHFVTLQLIGNNANYYDSFGIPPPKAIINKLNKIKGIKINFSDIDIQGYKSTDCGLFSIYLISNLSKGLNPQTIYSNFSMKEKTLPHNDKIVEQFYKGSGIMKKRRLCSICKQEGHDRRKHIKGKGLFNTSAARKAKPRNDAKTGYADFLASNAYHELVQTNRPSAMDIENLFIKGIASYNKATPDLFYIDNQPHHINEGFRNEEAPDDSVLSDLKRYGKVFTHVALPVIEGIATDNPNGFIQGLQNGIEAGPSLSAKGVQMIKGVRYKKLTGGDLQGIVNRISNFISGPRSTLPPQVKQFISQYGDWQIKVLEIHRNPLNSKIQSVLNFISGNQFSANKQRLGYDEVFHLYFKITLVDPKTNNSKCIVLEKNHVIQIKGCDVADERMPTAQQISVPLFRPVTFSDFIQRGIDLVGEYHFVTYTTEWNCQDFLTILLKANRLANSFNIQFLLQNSQELLKGLPITRKIANTVTNIGARLERLFHGDGLGKKRISKEKKKIYTYKTPAGYFRFKSTIDASKVDWKKFVRDHRKSGDDKGTRYIRWNSFFPPEERKRLYERNEKENKRAGFNAQPLPANYDFSKSEKLVQTGGRIYSEYYNEALSQLPAAEQYARLISKINQLHK